MMNGFARFILKGYSPATMVVVAAFLLSLKFSPLILVGIAALALVILVQGVKQGFKVLGFASLVFALFGYFLFNSAITSLSFSGLYELPVMFLQLALPMLLFAGLLRETRSLSFVTLIACLLAMIGVVLFHTFVANPAKFWQQFLSTELSFFSVGNTINTEQLNDLVQVLSRFATGIFAASFAMQLLGGLMIARWWQARLYQPGAFAIEFRTLRLPRIVGVGFIVVIALGVIQGVGSVFADLSIMLSALMVIYGISVGLAIVKQRQWPTGLVIAISVFFIFMPQFAFLFVLLALVDASVDLRKRIPPSTQQ